MSEYLHSSLASGRWEEMDFFVQMGNIGSEISRAEKRKKKGDFERMKNAVDRALELMDLTILCGKNKERAGGAGSASFLKELAREREVICDYFLFDNEYNSSGESLVKYFDQFAMAARK